MNWLFEKTVVISGASSGLGREMCYILAQKYHCKIVGLARNVEKLHETQEKVKSLSGEFVAYPMDVSKEQNWCDFKDFVIKNKINIDILINCAGTMPPFERFSSTTSELYERVFATNFFSATYATRILLPLLMKSKTPAVINISSAASLGIIPGTAVYSASKAALRSFSEILHSELKGKVYVATIMPGFAKTNLFSSKDNSRDTICVQDKSFVDKISMSADKMARKIVKAMRKRKARVILGFDAKLLNFAYKLTPQHSGNLMGKIMRKTKLKSFETVFDNNKTDNLENKNVLENKSDNKKDNIECKDK